jgi:hypothetical protein
MYEAAWYGLAATTAAGVVTVTGATYAAPVLIELGGGGAGWYVEYATTVAGPAAVR